MQAVLVMFRSDGERRSFSMARDMTVIGRREDCDLRIPLGDVSRKHCRVIRDGEMLKLEDLGSSNGTFLNGRRVQEALLSPGDSIQVGPVVFVLQVDGEPADEDLAPITVPAAVASGGGNADSGPLQPGGTVDDDLDELDTLEETEESLEEADDLEEIPADADAGSAVRAAAPNAAGDVRFNLNGLQFLIGRLAVDLQDEHDRTDLDGVAGREDRFLDARAVEEGAVGAAEVFELEAVAVAEDAAVLARDFAQGDAEVAVLAASDDGHVAGHGETAPLPVRSEHDQYRLHTVLT